jgi:hypothetical protein
LLEKGRAQWGGRKGGGTGGGWLGDKGRRVRRARGRVEGSGMGGGWLGDKGRRLRARGRVVEHGNGV